MIPGSLEAGRTILPTSLRPPARSTPSNIYKRPLQAAAGGAVYRLVQLLSVWRTRAVQRQTLSSLDDRLLKDIGLARNDVDREVMKPFWRP